MKEGKRPEGARYTSRIIKASALIPDTKALLYLWDETLSIPENLDRIRTGNLLGKPSRSRLDDILPIFRRRYLADPAVANALSVLVKGKLPSAALGQILYHYTLQADDLLLDFITQVLAPRYWAGRGDLSIAEVQSRLAEWRDAGRTSGPWSEETLSRVAQGILATLRDFGILTGAVNKHLNPPPLVLEAFAFIAFDRNRRQLSGHRLLSDPVWEALFLDSSLVERQFLAAHQAGLLHYAAAGSVVRIEFPVAGLVEYARLLIDDAAVQHARTAL